MWSIFKPIISFAVVKVIKGLFRLFSESPRDQNDTIAELQRHYERARKAEAEAKEMLEQAIRRLDEAAERARAAASEANLRDQAARERGEAAKRREEEAKRLAEETKQVILEAQIREEEANTREKEIKRREEAKEAASKAQGQEQHAKKNLERVNFYLSRGIQPEVWPTEDEFQSAKTRIQYDPEKLHLAVCGSSGSGKSSLVNAFRGLKNSDAVAATTGVVETTTSISRYPDPHDELPRSRFIWFDIPGAGTLNVPGWQYFNEQGLFIFDLIILVYDARFTQIDVTIIQHCERYHIPLFIVRSKADIQIKNILRDQFKYDEHEPDALKKYTAYHSAARQSLIDSTRRDFNKNLELADLMKRDVFIISNDSMYAVISEKWNQRNTATITNAIDEVNLLKAVLKGAHSRRYGGQASAKDHS